MAKISLQRERERARIKNNLPSAGNAERASQPAQSFRLVLVNPIHGGPTDFDFPLHMGLNPIFSGSYRNCALVPFSTACYPEVEALK